MKFLKIKQKKSLYKVIMSLPEITNKTHKVIRYLKDFYEEPTQKTTYFYG
jgi:hypothetical protein